MAFDAGKARVANQLIQDGVSAEQALIQAGVSPDDFDSYSINEVGTPSTNPSYGQIQSTFAGNPRPNETVVPAGRDPGVADAGEDIFQNAPVTSQSTTTTQTTQITGGGSTTRRVVPTQYENNATSNAIQAEANDLAAQKQARKDAIRAAGGSGADVLRDPEFRRLSNQQTAKEYEAQQARTAVPNTGGIVTTVTPGANETITSQTVDGNFVTSRGSGFDPQAQLTEANQPGTIPVSTFAARDVDVPAEIPDDSEGGAVGFPEGTFAGNGYGFVYNEDGELIPSDSVEAERIRNTSTDDVFAGNGYGFVYDEDGNLVPGDSAEAERIRLQTAAPDPFEVDGAGIGLTDEEIFAQDNPITAPAPPLNYGVTFEDGFGWVIVDNDTGSFIETDFASQAAAEAALARITGQGLGVSGTGAAGALAADDTNSVPAGLQAKVANARQQATIQQNRNRPATADWRVRLKLLPQADYLYKDPENAGILRPLRDQDGVIFPYMPRISTSYLANYDKVNLTHSNYRGYFYQNSSVQEVTIDGVFTAQDTREAEYLLAVIHFFRSVTKMFYGQDKYRGAPPPLVELFGLGQYQFNYHPCLISQFSYNLPNDVDYIRTDINNFGVNLSNRQERVSSSPFPLAASLKNLLNNGLTPGAEPQRRDVGTVRQTVSGLGVTTYVPTKMNIQIVLLPVQNRRQISSEFSVKEFANGVLLRGGFW